MKIPKGKRVKVTYTHWKDESRILEVEGLLPINLNNQDINDRIVVQCDNGKWEDVLKSTIKKLEIIS